MTNSSSNEIQRWETFNSATNWGEWIYSGKTDLSDGCYFVILNGCAVLSAGEIEHYKIAGADCAAVLADQLGDDIEHSVSWYHVKDGVAHSIGRWGLAPDFLLSPFSLSSDKFIGYAFTQKDGTGAHNREYQVFKNDSELVYFNANLNQTLKVPDDVQVYARFETLENAELRAAKEAQYDLDLLSI
jgi:hypothetical protein